MSELLNRIIDPVRDYTPRTPTHILKDFLSGSIHEDFLNELNIRIEQMRDFNEECGSKEYLETRGGIKALRLVALIFHDLVNNVDKHSVETKQEEI